MVEPLTAAVIVSLFFSEAIKESGQALGKGAADTFAKLVDTIREKFQANSIDGILTQAQNQPTDTNKTILQSVLQTQMDADAEFANKLRELVEQLKSQDATIRQVVLSDIEITEGLTVKDLTQTVAGDGSVEQVNVKGAKAANIDVSNLNQDVKR
ncbi:Fis family transcriptional regulator [Nostoc sp. HK-01]|nr:Fis family transcriptional regulator [Nostoc sp. HK-01]